MGILPMIHGHDARATAKEYVNIYLGRNTSCIEHPRIERDCPQSNRQVSTQLRPAADKDSHWRFAKTVLPIMGSLLVVLH